jgi:hypothetical protein
MMTVYTNIKCSLPFDEGRGFITAVSNVGETLSKSYRKEKLNYQDKDFFIKSAAMEIFNSCKATYKELINKQVDCRNSTLLNAAIETFNECINENEISYKINSFKLFKRINASLQKSDEILYERMGLKKMGDFILPPLDFNIAKADYDLYKENKRKTFCHDFTYYHLHDDNYPTIFAAKRVNASYLTGYKEVNRPSPGDLVLYIELLTNAFNLSHSGIWSQNNRVVSKFGSNGVFEHDINQVFNFYGTGVLFYTKTIRFNVTRLLLNEIKGALESVENFQHLACFSPLTTTGAKVAMLNHVEQQFEDLPSVILSKSLYGLPSMPALKKRLMKAIQLILVDNKNKRKFFNELSITVLKMDKISPLNFAALTDSISEN